MPTYTYQCQSCGHMKDEWRKMDDRDKPSKSCERCGKEVRRMFTGCNFIMDGDGHNKQYNKTGPRKG